jgi:uncharacterized damage-inducible protein DinB
MIRQSYSQLIAVKRWADRGLYDIVSRSLDRLNQEEASIMLRILDHIHVVDRIFQHHLQGLPHDFRAPRSERTPELQALASSARELDDWYVSYVESEPACGEARSFCMSACTEPITEGMPEPCSS